MRVPSAAVAKPASRAIGGAACAAPPARDASPCVLTITHPSTCAARIAAREARLCAKSALLGACV
jgi:hypothetical protein